MPLRTRLTAPRARAATAAAFAAAALLAGCGSIDRVSHSFADAITPYKIEIVQGNFVSKEQVAALHAGMSRTQARDVLGTPLLADPFHADRWDYVFTINRQGVPKQEHHLALFFGNDVLEKWEGDEMPSEAEFVATLDNKLKGAKAPPLTASEEKLKQFAAENKAQPAPSAVAAPPVSAASAASYPPLEPTTGGR